MQTAPEIPRPSAHPAAAGGPRDHGGPGSAETGPGPSLPFDPIRVVVAAARWWLVMLVSGVALAALAALAGWLRFDSHFTATVQLIRRELPNSFRASDLGESFKPRQFSTATITAMMRSPGLLAKVSARAQPRLSGRELQRRLVITPERNTDLITISFEGDHGREASAAVINDYAHEVVELTRALQTQEAAELSRFLGEQVVKVERELAEAAQDLLEFSQRTGFISADKEAEAYLRSLNDADARLQSTRLEREALNYQIAAAERELAQQNPLKVQLTEARQTLDALLVQYTAANPLVRAQETRIEALETRVAAATNAVQDFQAGPNTVANSLYLDLVSFRARRDAIDQQLPQLELYRTNILMRLKSVPEQTMNHARLRSRQTSLEVARDLLAGRRREADLFAENSPGYYRLFAETTPAQVTESSRLRKVLLVTAAGGALGAGAALLVALALALLDDRVVSPGDVRRLTRVPLLASLGDLDKLDAAELPVWRFRLWSLLQRTLGLTEDQPALIGLLSTAAGEGRSTWLNLIQTAAAERDWRTVSLVNRPSAAPEASLDLATALADPVRVEPILARCGHCEVTWEEGFGATAAERSAWRAALLAWGCYHRCAILVELPPGRRLESIMLAEHLPQVLWLSDSGAVRSGEVSSLLATLRLAGGRLAGAVLNRVPPLYQRLPDLSRFGLLFALGLGLAAASAARAEEELPTVGTEAPGRLSAGQTGPQLAPWQERLTLGPGDLVNLVIYGLPQTRRTQVPVGPDGRLNYLQVNGLLAAGLTIDELRDALNQELAAYYRHARVIVTPAEWRSKKYYLLGTILDRGTYYLDQPLTIIEATARARGIATGLLEQNTVEIADLPRTFLIRDGRRMPVDFVKLFEEGDLSQNIVLEPGDYIYFPSATLNEVFVLGSVDSPGTVGVTEKATVLSVITTRGGFTPKAYKQRVLVVRGSLTQPETHVVNLGAILAGQEPNFMVRPKDIVYVADRPWARVEELVDMAVKAFVVTATAEWVNKNVGPLIVEPVLPSP
ncbi:MAG: polysaccharide biosynthesis/export family protein [Verrucomicrobiales bacterium]|nr:polysaccharide biosynthesis/export family protein [Verrucomicrobiales bacterium]MCP5526690.1 polysaccharide biosynthesis/export family protein [Verrucomicrobiales bacterium]